MKLLIPPEIAKTFSHALEEAGRREIGGILMGEHVGPDIFRVKNVTVQRSGGTFATFLRFVHHIIGPLQSFFAATGHEYTRFNYLGEWHSHHSFALIPSGQDDFTMHEILEDQQVGALFALLLLVKQGEQDTVQYGLTVYQPGGRSYRGEIEEEG